MIYHHDNDIVSWLISTLARCYYIWHITWYGNHKSEDSTSPCHQILVIDECLLSKHPCKRLAPLSHISLPLKHFVTKSAWHIIYIVFFELNHIGLGWLHNVPCNWSIFKCHHHKRESYSESQLHGLKKVSLLWLRISMGRVNWLSAVLTDQQFNWIQA